LDKCADEQRNTGKKIVVFEVMEGPNKPQRPNRKWLDDVKDICSTI